MKTILILVLLFNLFCTGAGEKDAQDLYDESVVLFKLLEPVPNPQARCEAMMTKAGECIPNASDKITIPLQSLQNNTEKYTVILSTPEYRQNISNTQYLLTLDQSKLTYSMYCSTDKNSSLLSKATDAFKDCFYTCQLENFTSFVNSGVCSQKTAQTLAAESLGTGQNLCIIKCGKVTNN